jgi:hypothetical protein
MSVDNQRKVQLNYWAYGTSDPPTGKDQAMEIGDMNDEQFFTCCDPESTLGYFNPMYTVWTSFPYKKGDYTETQFWKDVGTPGDEAATLDMLCSNGFWGFGNWEAKDGLDAWKYFFEVKLSTTTKCSGGSKWANMASSIFSTVAMAAMIPFTGGASAVGIAGEAAEVATGLAKGTKIAMAVGVGATIGGFKGASDNANRCGGSIWSNCSIS